MSEKVTRFCSTYFHVFENIRSLNYQESTEIKLNEIWSSVIKRELLESQNK